MTLTGLELSTQSSTEDVNEQRNIGTESPKFSDDFVASCYGFTQKATYDHGQKNTAIRSGNYQKC